MCKKLLLISTVCVVVISLISFSAFAGKPDSGDDDFWNTENCIGTKWTDEFGNPISIEEKFGPGTMDVTRCLSKTGKVKVVYQINQECKNASCTAAYAIGNIINHINDYEITHGMTSNDYRVVAVIHSGGWKLVLDNYAVEKHPADNPFQSAMEDLVSRPSVRVLFCQNTAAKKGIVLANMIEGIGFVTAGISAIADLQEKGYSYLQP